MARCRSGRSEVSRRRSPGHFSDAISYRTGKPRNARGPLNGILLIRHLPLDGGGFSKLSSATTEFERSAMSAEQIWRIQLGMRFLDLCRMAAEAAPAS